MPFADRKTIGFFLAQIPKRHFYELILRIIEVFVAKLQVTVTAVNANMLMRVRDNTV